MERTDIQKIERTPVWALYEKGKNFHHMMGIYSDTDRNWRFYNDDQWGGAKLGGIEPVQENFIKPIVDYKFSVIHDNLFSVHYESQGGGDSAFSASAGAYCDMLNRYASRIWEADKMDKKCREVTRDAAVNSEGILYITFDLEQKMPVSEIVEKNDIYYGNENSEDIQGQPYILIRRRLPLVNAVDRAVLLGVPQEKILLILPDGDSFEQAGDSAKKEVEEKVTLIYKLYKKNGNVYYTLSSRYCELESDVNTGLTLYPVAHFTWETKKGSSRGEGEVRRLIPNQIEVNRTLMRRVLTTKNQAYPYKVVDVSKVSNPEVLHGVGGVLETHGQSVDDVRKVVGTVPPAQMSPDARNLEQDIVSLSRELAGAGDIATGQINPEQTSGRAMLVVKRASEAPIAEKTERFKDFVEDVGRIWLDCLIAYSRDGIDMEKVSVDADSGKESIIVEKVRQVTLQQLMASVRIEISPKGAFDKYAQEETLENLFVQGFLRSDRVGELEIFASLLDDGATPPKRKILDACRKIRENELKVAQINAKGQRLLQKVRNFFASDVDGQAQQISEAKRVLEQSAQAPSSPEEIGAMLMNNPDDN